MAQAEELPHHAAGGLISVTEHHVVVGGFRTAEGHIHHVFHFLHGGAHLLIEKTPHHDNAVHLGAPKDLREGVHVHFPGVNGIFHHIAVFEQLIFHGGNQLGKERVHPMVGHPGIDAGDISFLLLVPALAPQLPGGLIGRVARLPHGLPHPLLDLFGSGLRVPVVQHPGNGGGGYAHLFRDILQSHASFLLQRLRFYFTEPPRQKATPIAKMPRRYTHRCPRSPGAGHKTVGPPQRRISFC